MYESDGAKQYFKNSFQMANLLFHKKDLVIEGEEHFSATVHGWSEKRQAYTVSLIVNLWKLY